MILEGCRTALRILGYIISSMCLLLSPVQVILMMLKRRTMGENFSEWPFLATLANCLFWVLYELPSMHPHNKLILIINCIGVFLELIYLSVAFIFSPYRTRVTILVVSVMELVFVCVFSTGILKGVHPLETRLEVVGIFCVVSGIVMYASTIPSLVTAWKSKNTDDVSLLFVLVGLANSTIWLIIAILQHDLFMLIQNGCGILLVLVQLAVYVTICTYLSASPIETGSHSQSQ